MNEKSPVPTELPVTPDFDAIEPSTAGRRMKLTPLQTWLTTDADVIADARAQLDAREWAMFMEIRANRDAQELARIYLDEWRRGA